MKPLLKKPSAWIPVAMLGMALALLLGYLALFGATDPKLQADEGTVAHLFQLLMGGQVFIIAFFAIKWIPQEPKQALKVLAVQFCAGLLPMAVLFYFEHL